MRNVSKILIVAVIIVVALFIRYSKEKDNFVITEISNPNQPTTQVTEEQMYSNIKQKIKLPVYKPSFTAGYTYVSTPPAETTWQVSPSILASNSVWYKKGNSYFHVFNGIVGDAGDMPLNDEVFRTDSGKEVEMTVDGRIALWTEGENSEVYGIEVKDTSLPKEEIIKIINSMSKF